MLHGEMTPHYHSVRNSGFSTSVDSSATADGSDSLEENGEIPSDQSDNLISSLKLAIKRVSSASLSWLKSFPKLGFTMGLVSGPDKVKNSVPNVAVVRPTVIRHTTELSVLRLRGKLRQ